MLIKLSLLDFNVWMRTCDGTGVPWCSLHHASKR